MDKIATMLLKNQPKFHGQTTYGLSEDALRGMERLLRPGMNTLETGCGYSTVLFALAGARHCCITPNRAETELVADYCRQAGISTGQLDFRIGSSAQALPSMVGEGALQFVFIDGSHTFPYPFIDFHYTQGRLQAGGILGVDDCQIPTVRVLFDFLAVDDAYEKILYVHNTAFFRKVSDVPSRGWEFQRYNQQTQPLAPAGFFTRARRKLRRALARLS